MPYPPGVPLPERPLRARLAPAHGAYVVFTLNPLATVQALQDPIATSQAQALSLKNYVGYVDEHLDLSIDNEYMKCAVAFVSQGRPQACPAEGVIEEMCVPIGSSHHPTRPAIMPSPALPWDNLYHHTRLTKILRLSTREEDYDKCPLLPAEDLMLMTSAFNDDCWLREDLEHSYSFGQPKPRPWYPLSADSLHPESSLADDTFDRQVISSADHTIVASEQGGSDVSSDDDTDSEVDSLFDGMYCDSLTPVMDSEDPIYKSAWDPVPIVDYCLDLSTITEFQDGRHFFEELRALEGIRVASEKRRQAREELLKETPSVVDTNATSLSPPDSICSTESSTDSYSYSAADSPVPLHDAYVSVPTTQSLPNPALAPSAHTLETDTLLSSVVRRRTHVAKSTPQGPNASKPAMLRSLKRKRSFLSRVVSILTLGCVVQHRSTQTTSTSMKDSPTETVSSLPLTH